MEFKSMVEWQPAYEQELQDPLLAQGGNIIYDEEHQFIIRIQEKPNQIQTLKDTEKLRVKILVEESHGSYKSLKIQLTSDTELYFNFVFVCNDWDFKRIKENQNMFIEFRQYPQIVIKNFLKIGKDPKYMTMFTIFSQVQGKLDIIRKAQFKDDSILEFQFLKASEEQIKKSIQYRYDFMRRDYISYSARYEEISQVIKAKNPSLMMQINKILKKGK